MAKFKVGDKVKAIPMIASIANPERKGKIWEVTKVLGGDFYNLKADGKEIFNIPERIMTAANSRCVNSTRPIVQMALNRAFPSIPDFKPGDKIEYHGRKYIVKQGDYNRGPLIFIDPSKPNDELTASPFDVKLVNSSSPAGVVKNAYGLNIQGYINNAVREMEKARHDIYDFDFSSYSWEYGVLGKAIDLIRKIKNG